MKFKNNILILITLSLLLSVLGCVEESEDNDEKTLLIEAPLDQIALLKSDLPESFDELYMNYTTTPSTAINQTGKGITWQILERYDATYYLNVTNGVMESILKLDTMENAQNLTIYSKENILPFNYSEQDHETIGDYSVLLNRTVINGNITYNYITLMFSKGNVFVALGGSASDISTFIDYAKIIENRINITLQ